MNNQTDLVKICKTLNQHQIRYAIAGGYACALHGHIRATEDFDILVAKDMQNLELVVEVAKELCPGIEEPLTTSDIVDNIVVKLVDELEIDIMISAWSIDFEEAKDDILHKMLEDVDIPYLGLTSLIKSKSTQREIDQWDVRILREIERNNDR